MLEYIVYIKYIFMSNLKPSMNKINEKAAYYLVSKRNLFKVNFLKTGKIVNVILLFILMDDKFFKYLFIFIVELMADIFTTVTNEEKDLKFR